MTASLQLEPLPVQVCHEPVNRLNRKAAASFGPRRECVVDVSGWDGPRCPRIRERLGSRSEENDDYGSYFARLQYLRHSSVSET
ncbi:MAG: hypothetical protein ABI349_13045 [Casimicrobiaceae bacterium]